MIDVRPYNNKKYAKRKTHTDDIVESPEVCQPPVTSGEIHNAQVRSIVSGLLLKHGAGHSESNSGLLLVPFMHRAVNLLVPRVPEPFSGADRGIIASHQLPFSHVPLLLG